MGQLKAGRIFQIVMGESLETRPCPSDKHSTDFRPTLTVVTEVDIAAHSFKTETDSFSCYGLSYTLAIPLCDFDLSSRHK